MNIILQKSIETITGGYYDYIKNGLIIFEENEVIIVCLRTRKEVIRTNKSKYFGLTDDIKLTHVLVYFKYLILFCEHDILLFDNNKKKIISFDTNELREFKLKLDKLPKKFNNCFINFWDVSPQIPLGNPTFIKKNKIFILDLKDLKIKGPKKLSNKLNLNIESKIINNSSSEYNIKETGNYRIYIVGAGTNFGGRGGFLFNDYFLKNTDTLSFLLGSPGEKIPVKSKSDNKLSQIYSTKLPF